MKLIRLVLLLVFGLAASVNAGANDFEVALSSETADFTFRSDSSLIGWGGSDLGFGVFYNDESDFLLQGSLMQMRQASEETPLTFGVGVKAYLGSLDKPNEDILALAIGGELRYTIPGAMPMAIFLRGHLAPDITSFSGANEVIDYTLGFQIEALPQTIAFIGVRHLEIELDQGDYEADDDNVHLGVRLTF